VKAPADVGAGKEGVGGGALGDQKLEVKRGVAAGQKKHAFAEPRGKKKKKP